MFCTIGQDSSFLLGFAEGVFLGCLIFIFIADWKKRRIPNYSLVLIWGSVLLRGYGKPGEMILSAAAGGCMISVPFGILHYLKPDSLGWADVKLTAAIGAYMGYQAVCQAVLAGVLISVIYCIVRMTDCRKRQESIRMIRVPLGSFICLGTFVVRMMK